MLGWVLKPLAIASSVALSTLGVLSRKYERAKLYFHLTLYLSTLGAMSAWGLIVTILATATGRRFNINYYVARSFYGICSPLVGIKMHVEGREHLDRLLKGNDGKPESAVLIGNHQSLLDVLFMGRMLPKRSAIMAKKELIWTPLLGQFIWLSGGVFVDRKNRKSAVEALEQAGRDMKRKGVSLWVYPEGTRSSCAEPTLLPFKKGAFHLAVGASVPIIPIVCENYHRLFDGKTRMEEGTLRIKVLPPISTTDLTADDVTALTESTREMMLATLREISAPGPAAVEDRKEAIEELVESAHKKEGDKDSSLRQRRSDREGSKSGDEGKGSSSETTEDEMDEDAVLLKRP